MKDFLKVDGGRILTRKAGKGAVRSEIKSISSVRKEAIVTIEKATIQREENAVLQSFSRDVKIPGFRKGKVPAALIKSRYAKELEEQVEKSVASKAYDDIVKENNWNIFSLAKFNVRSTPSGDKELTFTVDLKPEFELFDYRNIALEEPEIGVSDAEIGEAIEQIRHHYADYRAVNRPVQRGDFVRLRYAGRLEDGTKMIDVVPQKPIWAEQMNTWEEAGSANSPGIKAVTEGIVAMEIDGEKDIEMDFAADFEVPELQGKKAIYHVKIFEIREKILPDLGAEFFEKLKIKDLEELKARLERDIRSRKVQMQRFEQRETIVQKMIDSATFEIPESAAQFEQIYVLRNLIERQIHEGTQSETAQNNRERLYEEAQEIAHDRAKVNFILEKIAQKENITVSEQEISQMIIQEAAARRISPDQLVAELRENSERNRDLHRRALFGKTLDFVLVSNLKNDASGENAGALTESEPQMEDSIVNI
ncbi:MAG: trigger factor [Puniceicoccales bacterium]|nr:trigger factor [Puniceicoccales bacterium]